MWSERASCPARSRQTGMTTARDRSAHLESNAEWMRWAMDDPLWAVVTEPERKRGERRAWTDEEFYSSGEADWQDFLLRWRQYGVDTKNCLEIGCGAGRITKQLSLLFKKVYAIDVSPTMIAYARSAIS